MTSVPMSAGGATPASRPATAPAAAPVPAMGSSIDPLRLLNKYKFLLLGVAIAGAVTGYVANAVLRRVYPLWTPAAVFNCLPPTKEVSDLVGAQSQEEMSRFMQTQVRVLTSTQVLNRVSEDPALRTNAPEWSSRFEKVDTSTGAPAFDSTEALKKLKDDVKARVIPGTNLIEVSMSWRNKHDATAIVGLVRQKYMAMLADQGRAGLDDKIAALNGAIKSLEDEAGGLSIQKENLIQQNQVDTIDNRVETSRQELNDLTGDIIEVQRTLDSGRTRLAQMDAEINNPGGIVYGADLREEVEREPQLNELRSRIQLLETEQQSMLQQGYSRDHRQYVFLQSQLDATKQSLEIKRDEALRKAFAGELDRTRKLVAQFEAQEKTLLEKRATAQKRLQDLTRIQSRLNDLDNRIRGIAENRTRKADELSTLKAQASTLSVNRVLLQEQERPPTELSFPQLKLLLPAGVALFVFLTAGVVLLLEIVDQRVKSPSDIAIIPRARLLGWVPDAAEDPAGQGAAETAFRDRPRGIVAESFRQLRAGVTKRVQASDHRAILVLSGMPASGATTVAANLALAFAAADRKVLLIDANFRRPGLHRVFAVPESPGLADVLAGQRDLAQCAQATNVPNLDLLTAGIKDQRVYERLSSAAMGEILAKVRAMYDLVLIDVAPAIVGGDAMALAQRCDATILVVRARADKRGMVARIKNELSESRSEFLGILVNAVRSASGGYMKRNIKTAHEYQNTST
ncbi:MAG: polysaccharide biosynthesis tyrosine autokinase [Planctomycetota bacterium]|nr:polysaccharide biosynthesis tyrosine autokinase [Planctomycetota bacterium]